MNVEEIVKTTLQAEILKALKAAPEAIEAMVKAAIEKPVDPDTGKPTGYGNKVPYLEYIVGDALRTELYNAVQIEFASRRDEIRAAVKKRLADDDIADAVASSVLKVAAESWRISVKFEGDKER
jgi:hypothetical protein